MATLIQQFALSQNTHLRARISVALIVRAALVRQETRPAQVADGPGPGDRRWVKRQGLAAQATVSVESLVAPFAWQCATNADIANAATYGEATASNPVPSTDSMPIEDSAIEEVVSEQWDEVAGVLPDEMP